MSWIDGIRADVEARSFPALGGWVRYLESEADRAEKYRPSKAKIEAHSDVEEKVYVRRPYLDAVESILEKLRHGRMDSDPDTQAALDHVRRCIG